jgi:hypothetical protein
MTTREAGLAAERYYGRHLKDNIDAFAVNVRKVRRKADTARKQASKSTK